LKVPFLKRDIENNLIICYNYKKIIYNKRKRSEGSALTVNSFQNVDYFNILNSAGQVNSYAIRNETQSIFPDARAYGSDQNPKAVYNLDGDSAEISNKARNLFIEQPEQGPVGPVTLTGNFPAPATPSGKPSGSEIPEIPGSGLLESLKPQGECTTCSNRKYIDRSDDASVSFHTPTNISPNMAAGAVAAHENEHVRNEKGKAVREDREIVNQTVTLTYDCCPECGRSYVSGGTTRTTSVSKSNSGEMTSSNTAPMRDSEVA